MARSAEWMDDDPRIIEIEERTAELLTAYENSNAAIIEAACEDNIDRVDALIIAAYTANAAALATACTELRVAVGRTLTQWATHDAQNDLARIGYIRPRDCDYDD